MRTTERVEQIRDLLREALSELPSPPRETLRIDAMPYGVTRACLRNALQEVERAKGFASKMEEHWDRNR